jgi:hypothetical protein
MHYDHDIVAHITEVPTIEISDGIVLVRYRIGGAPVLRTLTLKTANKAGERLARAMARYAAGEQNVIVDD